MNTVRRHGAVEIVLQEGVQSLRAYDGICAYFILTPSHYNLYFFLVSAFSTMGQSDLSKLKFARVHIYYNPDPVTGSLITSQKAFEVFRQLFDYERIHIQEQAYILFLNSNLEVIAWDCLAVGNQTSVPVDVGLILSLLSGFMVKRIIIAHNHTSERIIPTQSDINLTHKIVKACGLINAVVEDHLIIGRSTYYSFSDNGIMP